MSERRYRISYAIDVRQEPKGITKSELEALGRGGTDGLVLASVLRDQVGGLDIEILSCPDVPPLRSTELFMVALGMLESLKERVDVPEPVRLFCREIAALRKRHPARYN